MREDKRDRSEHIEKTTRIIPNMVSPNQNGLLMNPMELQEVEVAVHQMADGKAPSLDVFATNFSHHF